MKGKGFTLIELLIVVAIIGILAAIAVPNFLNAQTRAKVARCYADMKSLTTAISSFGTDRGEMLVDIRDDDNDSCCQRIQKDFGGVGWNGSSGNRNNLAVLSPLTSPVSYMSSIPRSPFVLARDMTLTSGNNEAWGRVGNDVYAYWDNDPQVPDNFSNPYDNNDFNLAYVARYLPSFKPWDFVLISFGPASKGATLNYMIPYHPSNGLNSTGEIFATNYGVNNENCPDHGPNASNWWKL